MLSSVKTVYILLSFGLLTIKNKLGLKQRSVTTWLKGSGVSFDKPQIGQEIQANTSQYISLGLICFVCTQLVSTRPILESNELTCKYSYAWGGVDQIGLEIKLILSNQSQSLYDSQLEISINLIKYLQIKEFFQISKYIF